MTLKNKDGLSTAAHAQTDGYSLIKIRQNRQIRPDYLAWQAFEREGKGGFERERNARGPRQTPTFPSLQGPATEAIDGSVRLQ